MTRQLTLPSTTRGSSAVLLPPYRYLLSRRWGDGPTVAFVGLNPSVAAAEEEDHTTRKWRGFCERYGWGGYHAVNMYAWIETDASKLAAIAKRGNDIEGPLNDFHIIRTLAKVSKVVLCWGNLPAGLPVEVRARARHVVALATMSEVDILCWGRTKSGQPKHPARLPYQTPLVPY